MTTDHDITRMPAEQFDEMMRTIDEPDPLTEPLVRAGQERKFRSMFWDDLAEDLKDPEFLRAFEHRSKEIAEADRQATEDVVDPDGPLCW